MAKKENSKSGKFLKKRKKRFPVVLVILLLAALAVGGWWAVTNLDLIPVATEPAKTQDATPNEAPQQTYPMPSETTEPEETTEPAPATRPAGDYELPQAYQDVLALYAQAVAEKWEMERCQDNQICYMVMFHEDLSRLGYHTPDLDHDGVRELIISDGGVIYDLYTLEGEELVWLLTGGERNSYQLCMDGYIFNHGAISAASFCEDVYYVKNGQLVLKEGLLFDDMNETSKWMRSGEGIEGYEPITPAQAQEIISTYRKVAIPITPFPENT